MVEFALDPVKPGDKQAIIALSEKIWDGHDYMPKVFDDWVKDGGFYCGRVDGKLVSLAKYTNHPNGVLWLEGLRVHPDFQGIGYGRLMVDAFFHHLGEMEWKELRFMTAEVNKESIHMAKGLGFHLLATYDYFFLMKEDYPRGVIVPPNVTQCNDADLAWDLVSSSKEKDLQKNQYLAHWTAYDMDKKTVGREVEKGHCYVHKNDNGEVDGIFFVFHYPPYNTLSIAFMTGTERAVSDLMVYALATCKKEKYDMLAIKTNCPLQIKAAKAANMSTSEIGKVFVYSLVR